MHDFDKFAVESARRSADKISDRMANPDVAFKPTVHEVETLRNHILTLCRILDKLTKEAE